jgi:hypothetical protein
VNPEPKKQLIEASTIRVQFTQNVLIKKKGNKIQRFNVQDSGEQACKITLKLSQSVPPQFHRFLSRQRRDTIPWRAHSDLAELQA